MNYLSNDQHIQMIRFDHISVKLNGRYIIKDFNLNIDKGEKVLIYGESGIGKSTLLRLLLGFVQPDSGKIYFENKLLDKKIAWDIRKRIAYVCQDLDFGEGKVKEIINDVLSLKANVHIGINKYNIKTHLEYFRLEEEILSKNLEDLSGGEKQRIAIIIAILLQRDIFLLDEITSALDVDLKNKAIRYFTENDNWTVLIISHDKNWLKSNNVRMVNLKE